MERLNKSRLHKDFGKQSFEDLCELFENDDCDFEYYKRIYADDIDQLIKENYDHIPKRLNFINQMYLKELSKNERALKFIQDLDSLDGEQLYELEKILKGE